MGGPLGWIGKNLPTILLLLQVRGGVLTFIKRCTFLQSYPQLLYVVSLFEFFYISCGVHSHPYVSSIHEFQKLLNGWRLPRLIVRWFPFFLFRCRLLDFRPSPFRLKRSDVLPAMQIRTLARALIPAQRLRLMAAR